MRFGKLLECFLSDCNFEDNLTLANPVSVGGDAADVIFQDSQLQNRMKFAFQKISVSCMQFSW